MVTVVIAEKRSVAQAVACALGGGVERDGMIVCDGVRVTWAHGHLVELAEPGEYRDEWQAWRLETLPIDPDVWRWRVDPRARSRWDAVRAIVGAPDVDALSMHAIRIVKVRRSSTGSYRGWVAACR